MAATAVNSSPLSRPLPSAERATSFTIQFGLHAGPPKVLPRLRLTPKSVCYTSIRNIGVRLREFKSATPVNTECPHPCQHEPPSES